MTTSANIATVPQPFAVAGHGTRPWPYGVAKVYKVDEIKPKKKKKKEKINYGAVGMLYVGQIESIEEGTEVGQAIMKSKRKGPKAKVVDAPAGKKKGFTEPVGNPKDGLWKIPSLGKIGVWRTVKGRRYFFPVDGSAPIPKIPGAKKGGAPGQGGENKYKKVGEKKKKGLLDRIKDFFGGGGGAKATVKDVKPKKGNGKKKKGKTNIPDGQDMLDKVEEMMLKASRSKGGRKVAGALKKMQAALKSDDPDAFKKAEVALAKATMKLQKKKGG
jgi:hypothetical protein